MTELMIELSHDAADYNRISVDTVTLVNAMSNSSVGQSHLEAGIGVQFSVDGKALRVPLVTPLQIARQEVNVTALEAQIAEILRTTCVGTQAKKNKQMYLDPNWPNFTATVKRLAMMASVAATNFARDIGTLVKLYDAYTGSTDSNLPPSNAFTLKTAFSNKPLFDAYRAANGLPVNTTPMLTDKAREILTRFNVASSDIPTYDPSRSRMAELPAGPAALRAAYELTKVETEVQIMLQALDHAAQAGIIAPVTIDRNLHQQLAMAIASTRQSTPVQAAATPAAPGLYN